MQTYVHIFHSRILWWGSQVIFVWPLFFSSVFLILFYGPPSYKFKCTLRKITKEWRDVIKNKELFTARKLIGGNKKLLWLNFIFFVTVATIHSIKLSTSADVQKEDVSDWTQSWNKCTSEFLKTFDAPHETIFGMHNANPIMWDDDQLPHPGYYRVL